MAKASQNNLLIALVLIVIGVVIVAFMLTKETEPTNNNEVEEPLESAPAQNFNYLMPKAWSYTEDAVEDIQELTPGQVLTFGIVPNPEVSGTYYFATTAPDPSNEDQTLHSIYAYNGKDYSFERIYRISYSDEKAAPGLKEGVITALHPMGYDDGKLIILAQDLASSPGPCTEVLTLGRQANDEVYEVLALDLSDPFAQGLQPYRVPDDIYEAAQDRGNACVEDLF